MLLLFSFVALRKRKITKTEKKQQKNLDKQLDELIERKGHKDSVPIDFTKDSEYIRLFGTESHKLGIEAFE